ncbi:hypothetical protein HYH03_018668 [Edaphochlamys debaryana]|uniref:Uncharacterized protein n=1 Tax=Edaphochlamys debaryana TaxID=47281 RepID=A0A835XJT0_9CHLO|nr:hypothetical protein HYH03_018668 [Edaphochlamys debaryana]|eukprot:KAG2482390.1 hypothetical protein HYH03_018668 [Edaphochlamys debaryana]
MLFLFLHTADVARAPPDPGEVRSKPTARGCNLRRHPHHSWPGGAPHCCPPPRPATCAHLGPLAGPPPGRGRLVRLPPARALAAAAAPWRPPCPQRDGWELSGGDMFGFEAARRLGPPVAAARGRAEAFDPTRQGGADEAGVEQGAGSPWSARRDLWAAREGGLSDLEALNPCSHGLSGGEEQGSLSPASGEECVPATLPSGLEGEGAGDGLTARNTGLAVRDTGPAGAAIAGAPTNGEESDEDHSRSPPSGGEGVVKVQPVMEPGRPADWWKRSDFFFAMMALPADGGCGRSGAKPGVIK